MNRDILNMRGRFTRFTILFRTTTGETQTNDNSVIASAYRSLRILDTTGTVTVLQTAHGATGE